MPKSYKDSKRVTLHTRVNKEVVETFDRLYPDLLSLYLERAIIIATQNREVFEQIFFNDAIKSSFLRS